MPSVSLYNNKPGVPSQMDIGNAVHTGGEGHVFFSVDGKYAIKVYHAQRDQANKRKFLERVMSIGAKLTMEENQFLCWPVALVQQVDGNACVGCVTRRIPKPPYRELMDIMLTPKQAAAQFKAGRSWAHYLQIARGIARSIAVLHGKGCAHADLHFRNFLVDPQTAGVVLLDLDGLVVRGFLPPQVAGMTGFMAPEVIAGDSSPDVFGDRHSLAVLVLYTLLFRNVLAPLVCYDPNDQANDENLGWGKEAVFSEHPQDRRNCPRMLGVPLFQRGALSYRVVTPALQRLTERAFSGGLHNPDQRPSAREWTDALGWAVDELWPCCRCHLHFPYPHWVTPAQRRGCPFCGQRVGPPFPPVLLVYEPRSGGNYALTQRHLVGGNGWRLFADVLDPSRNPPISRRSESVAGHIEWGSTSKVYRLVNDEGPTWRARLGEGRSDLAVAKGASLPLTARTTIYFGEGRRLAVVK